jgi:hypothetical protein
MPHRPRALATFALLPSLSAAALAAIASLAAAALAPAVTAAADEPDAGAPQPADLRTVSGKITTLAWAQHRFTVEASDGPVTLSVDRNTTVYLDTKLGSIRDLIVGTPVRTSYGKDLIATWVEVRTRGGIPTPARDALGGGTPPALAMPPGAPPAPAPVGGTPPSAAGDGGTPAGPAREVPAGPPAPEPSPGASPPAGPASPPPSGPGPVPGGGPLN